jgi:hypothetical protein
MRGTHTSITNDTRIPIEYVGIHPDLVYIWVLTLGALGASEYYYWSEAKDMQDEMAEMARKNKEERKVMEGMRERLRVYEERFGKI